MSRIILLLELILGIVALSIYAGGGDILSLVVLSPFLLILVFPAISALAVWPASRIYTAYRDALHHDSGTIPDPVSIYILAFCEKIAYIGVFIGAVVGIIILLNNTYRLSVNSIYSIGPHALTGTISALIIAIILKQISGLFRHPQRMRSEETYADTLKLLCETYGITQREKEIIKMIAGGLSNREICRNLDISHDTVRNHVYNIFRKTGVKNRNGLVGMLLDKGNGKSI